MARVRSRHSDIEQAREWLAQVPNPIRFGYVLDMQDAKSLAKTAARCRAGAELVATQPWAPEAYRLYDVQIGISLGDLRLLKRVVLGSEVLNEAAAALGIPKDEAEQRLREGLTGLAAGYEAADKPRPGERADCRCAHCGGVMPATNAA